MVNEATADGENESDEPTDPGDDDVEDPTDDKNSHLTIEKITTSEPKDAKGYVAGEEITYQITVLNDGNVTISNITVTDELTGDNWTIDKLAPNESKDFEASYTVTEDDQVAGEVLNVATATGKDPEDKDPEVDPGEDPEPTKTSVVLTVLYYVDGTLDESMTFKKTYKAGDSYNVTSPQLAGYSVDKEAVSGVIKTDKTEEVHYTANSYTLTIYYRYADTGLAVRAPIKQTHKYGETYRVASQL